MTCRWAAKSGSLPFQLP